MFGGFFPAHGSHGLARIPKLIGPRTPLASLHIFDVFDWSGRMTAERLMKDPGHGTWRRQGSEINVSVQSVGRP